MLQTAYGSLTAGLDAQPGQSILIRAVVPIDRVYGFDHIVDAHAAMEVADGARKLVAKT
jgi:hypothetical protein